jgi:putative dimethyl sulfoxide reductase chaperone
MNERCDGMKVTSRTKKDISDLFMAREKIYHFFYLIFSKPLDYLTIVDIKENSNWKVFKDLNEAGLQLSEFFLGSNPEELFREEDEFLRLFIGPGSMIAPPWEAFYTSEERLLFGESTLLVREAYRQGGLKFIEENRYPEDHIIIEFEFMMFLIREYSVLLTDKQVIELAEKQLGFIMKHLVKWIPLFCNEIIANTNSKLYSGAAGVLKDFILIEIELLNELKEELTNG